MSSAERHPWTQAHWTHCHWSHCCWHRCHRPGWGLAEAGAVGALGMGPRLDRRILRVWGPHPHQPLLGGHSCLGHGEDRRREKAERPLRMHPAASRPVRGSEVGDLCFGGLRSWITASTWRARSGKRALGKAGTLTPQHLPASQDPPLPAPMLPGPGPRPRPSNMQLREVLFCLSVGVRQVGEGSLGLPPHPLPAWREFVPPEQSTRTMAVGQGLDTSHAQVPRRAPPNSAGDSKATEQGVSRSPPIFRLPG